METVPTKMSSFREIEAFLIGKTARHSSRRDPYIIKIESTSCGLKVPHGGPDSRPFISKLKKFLQKESMGCMKIKGKYGVFL